LTLTVLDREGKPLAGTEAVIKNKSGQEVYRASTDSKGILSAELIEYEVSGSRKETSAPYTVETAGQTESVNLNKNTELNVRQ
jgi:hypothetical protein